MILLLPRRVTDAIHAELRKHLPLETGGFLIGVRRGPHIEVTNLTTQGPDDIATRTSFERRCASHRERIHAAWRSSGFVETLVGDWHTHPAGTADASSIDWTAWRTLVRTSGQAMIGMIDDGNGRPALYLAAERQQPFATQLTLREEDFGALAFEGPDIAANRPLMRGLEHPTGKRLASIRSE